MKKFVICETVNHYHMVEVDDEIDIEKVVRGRGASSMAVG